MPAKPRRSKTAAPSDARKRRSAKTPKTYRLDERTIAAAQEILGAATATKAIETERPRFRADRARAPVRVRGSVANAVLVEGEWDLSRSGSFVPCA